MKKIIVIGCSGSGKSHFSKSLCSNTGLPLYHLDLINWRKDGTSIERAEFDKRLSEILSTDEWIIDGNYNRTMERRLTACDTVFFFDLPTEVCLSGIEERKGKLRLDMAWADAPENDDPEFVEFIKGYNVTHRPSVMALLEKYSDKNIFVFNSRQQADDFIINMK